MARNERDVAKERVWRGVLTRQAVSGLSVRAFCRREMLAESNFYAWRRVIAKRDGEATPREATPREMRPAFVPAIVTDVPRAEASIIVELAGGRRLRLPSSMSMRRLARLVHALEAGPRGGEAEA
ncbi:MAG: hypothetical protein JXO22_08690 [Phycisphaerae bacterium]|nr:hypothetical protein [Phycisphaerae bacterium]